MNRRRLLLATTIPASASAFLSYQMRSLSDRGWDVHLVTSAGDGFDALMTIPGVTVHELAMKREISPRHDSAALIRWIRLVGQIRPDIVMVGTPKASLLGLVAAFIRRVPRRVYLVRGLRLETLSGYQKWISALSEIVSCRLAQSVVCVSPSLMAEMRRLGLSTSGRLRVIGSGSSNGVDTERFRPGTPAERAASRAKYGIENESLVVGYVGRLAPDKGIITLVEASKKARVRHRDLVLVIVGGLDATTPLTPAQLRQLEAPWIVKVGQLNDTASVYWAMDILALPSLREGYPTVTLEASSAALPILVSNATGCRDSVIDGITGTIVETTDVEAWGEAIHELAESPELRQSMGAMGRKRMLDHFRQEDLVRELDEFLVTQLATMEGGQTVRKSGTPTFRRASKVKRFTGSGLNR